VTFIPSKLSIPDIAEEEELTLIEIPPKRSYLISEKNFQILINIK